MFEEFCAKKEPVNTDSLILFIVTQFSDRLALISWTPHETLRAMLIEYASDAVMWTD
jgi:hypothetical protein